MTLRNFLRPLCQHRHRSSTTKKHSNMQLLALETTMIVSELTKNHLKSHRSTKNSHKQHRHINQQYLNLKKKKKKKSHFEYQEAANTTAMDIVLLFHYQNSIAMMMMMMTKVSSNVFRHIPTSFKSINCSTQYNQNQPTEQSENKK